MLIVYADELTIHAARSERRSKNVRLARGDDIDIQQCAWVVHSYESFRIQVGHYATRKPRSY